MPANKYPRAADPKQGTCFQDTARAHPCGLLLRHPVSKGPGNRSLAPNRLVKAAIEGSWYPIRGQCPFPQVGLHRRCRVSAFGTAPICFVSTTLLDFTARQSKCLLRHGGVGHLDAHPPAEFAGIVQLDSKLELGLFAAREWPAIRFPALMGLALLIEPGVADFDIF
jgi:hypothetical protein